MIQRKQSLFLLLGALALVATFFIDVLWRNDASDAFAWYTPAVLVLLGISAVGGIAAIFMYRNRENQRKTVLAVQFVLVVGLLVMFGALFGAGAMDELVRGPESTMGILGLVLPILAYVFYFLARRSIQADIALVRSMDRLR